MASLSSWLRILSLSLPWLGSGCIPSPHAIQQSSLVTLPTAPPAAADSGGVAMNLGVAVPTDVRAPAGDLSGLAIPVVQPEGGVSVRLADFVALRGFFAVAPAAGQRTVTATLEGPSDDAFAVGLGPSFRMLFANEMVFLDLAPTFGFAILPSRLRIQRNPVCITPFTGCEPPGSPYSAGYRGAMPLFALTLNLGLRPIRWLGINGALTLRNQPTNLAEFETGDGAASSLNPGSFGLVIGGGVQVDFIDELGVRIDIQWAAVGAGLDYGPILGLSLQARIDGSLNRPFGQRI